MFDDRNMWKKVPITPCENVRPAEDSGLKTQENMDDADNNARREQELYDTFLEEIESKKRKKYLGPDSGTRTIPKTTKWRYQQQRPSRDIPGEGSAVSSPAHESPSVTSVASSSVGQSNSQDDIVLESDPDEIESTHQAGLPQRPSRHTPGEGSAVSSHESPSVTSVGLSSLGQSNSQDDIVLESDPNAIESTLQVGVPHLQVCLSASSGEPCPTNSSFEPELLVEANSDWNGDDLGSHDVGHHDNQEDDHSQENDQDQQDHEVSEEHQQDNHYNQDHHGRYQDIPQQNHQGMEGHCHFSHPILRDKMHGQFSEPIETPVQATRNDILYMSLGFALRNHEPNLVLNHMVSLLNNIFASPILPNSRYLLDKLLNNDVGVEYYFYCNSCSQLFGCLDYKTVKTYLCNNESCGRENVISDLRIASYFVMFDVAIQLEVLFSDPDILGSLVTPAEAVQQCRPGEVSDICNGSMYKEFAASTSNLNGRVLSAHFNTDGSPVAENSKNSIWPIQLALNELPFEKRSSNLLLAGLWFGKSQPKMDLFLHVFVGEIQKKSQGFHLQNIGFVFLFVTGCCVDSGARGPVQGIKKHSGYHSCSWCTIEGVYLNRAVRFPLPEANILERTHQQIVQLQHRLMEEELSDEDDAEEPHPRHLNFLGVTAVSPLINLPRFEMINGFFVDVMHMVDLGICRAFLSLWLEDVGKPYYVGLSEDLINSRIKDLRPPLEFRRKPRELSERAWFSAKECHNFLMFECVPVMKGILPDRYLNNWLLLTQALYLLSQNEVSLHHCNVASLLITHFLVRTQNYYDEVNMSYNLHILKHLAAHVLRWGPSWASSAYSFEAGNGALKKLIHSVGCIPQQILRAFSWSQALKLLQPHASQSARTYVESIVEPKSHQQMSLKVLNCRLIGGSKEPILSEEDNFVCEQYGHEKENLSEYNKLVYKQCTFTVSSNICAWSNNNFAQLCDRSIVFIRKILFDCKQNTVVLLVSNVHSECLLRLPTGVQLHPDDHFMRKMTSIDEERRYILFSDLKIICFRACFPHCDFVAPFPNVHNRF